MSKAPPAHHAFPEGFKLVRVGNELREAMAIILATLAALRAKADDDPPSEQLAKILKDIGDRNGGYFSLFIRYDSRGGPMFLVPLVTCIVGSVPVQKLLKYMQLSCEKAERLMRIDYHVTSWQSRNPEYKTKTKPWGLWGGAVTGDELVWSFSGLPELVDETLTTLTAVRCGDLSPVTALLYAEMSSNELLELIVREKYAAELATAGM